MAKLRRVNEEMSPLELGRLLDVELPMPDPMTDRDDWPTVMQRRYARGAELGCDTLGVFRCVRLAHDSRYPGLRGVPAAFGLPQTGAMRRPAPLAMRTAPTGDHGLSDA